MQYIRFRGYKSLPAEFRFRRRANDVSRRRRTPLLSPLTALRQPAFLAEALATSQAPPSRREEVIKWAGVSEEVFSSWEANYRAKDLSEAIEAVSQGRNDFKKAAPHQLLSLPSALQSGKDIHLLISLLDLTKESLHANIYGELLAESLHAITRLHHQVHSRQLVNYFLYDSSALLCKARRNVQTWEKMFKALLNSSARQVEATAPTYDILVKGFFRQFTVKPEHKSRLINIETIQLMFSRAELLTPDACDAAEKFLDSCGMLCTVPIALSMLKVYIRAQSQARRQAWDRLHEAIKRESGYTLCSPVPGQPFEDNSLITEAHLIFLQSSHLQPETAKKVYQYLRGAVLSGIKSEITSQQLDAVMLDMVSRERTMAKDQFLQLVRTEEKPSPEHVGIILRGFNNREDHSAVLEYWNEIIKLDPSIVPTHRAIRAITYSLLQLGRWDEAIAFVTWHAIPATSFSNYLLTEDSPIPTLWPNRVPLHCTAASRHTVSLATHAVNLLLEHLMHKERWQDFYRLWKLLQNGSVYKDVTLNDRSLQLFIRTGLLASARSGRGGNKVEHLVGESRRSEAKRDSDLWDGIPAWRRAAEMFESVFIAAWPEFAEGPEKVVDPLKGSTGLAGMVKKGKDWLEGKERRKEEPERKAVPTISLAQMARFEAPTSLSIIPSHTSFLEYILLIGLFARTRHIPYVLGWIKAISDKEGGRLPVKLVTVALCLYENADEVGRDGGELAVLEDWLKDWMQDRFPSEERRARARRWLQSARIFSYGMGNPL